MIKDSLNEKYLIGTQPGARAYIMRTAQTIATSTTVTSQNNSKINSSKIELSNSSSSSSLYTNNLLTNYEECINFTNEIFSTELTNIQRANLPTYLITNVKFNKSNQYAYLITMNGDVFFFKMTVGNLPIKTAIWHRSINVIVLKCHKIDINVRNFQRTYEKILLTIDLLIIIKFLIKE